MVSENFMRQTEMLRGLRNGRQPFTSKSSVQIQLRLVMNKKYLPLLFTVCAKWIGGSGSIPSNKPACHNWQLRCHSQQTAPRIKWSIGSKVTSPPLQARVEAHWQEKLSQLPPEQGCATAEQKDMSLVGWRTITFSGTEFANFLKIIIIIKDKNRCHLVWGRLVTQTRPCSLC